MTRIIGFIVLIVVLLIGYNYFFGNAEEKEKATKIVNEVKDLGEDVKDLFEDQKEKYERGDYDKILDKIGSFVDKLKANPSELDAEETKDLEKIEKEIRKIEDKLKEVDLDDEKTIESLEDEIKVLIRKANDLVKDLDQK